MNGVVAQLPQFPGETRLSVLTRLGTILIRYGQEKDKLSKNLLIIGQAVMTYGRDNFTKPNPQFLEGLIEKVEELLRLLQNPYGVSTFNDPWLVERTVVWDKSTLDEYQRYLNVFQQGRVVEATPHLFARELLQFLPRLAVQVQVIDELMDAPPNEALLRDYQQYQLYSDVINKSKNTEQALRLAADLKVVAINLEKENTVKFEEHKQRQEQQEMRQEQQTAELKEEIAKVKEQTKKTADLYNEAEKESIAALNQLKAEFEKQQIQMNSMQSQIDYQCNQIAVSNQNLAALQDDVNNQDSCVVM